MTRKKFEFLAEVYMEKISKGELLVGDKLPSESELCSLHHLSRTTVRSALSYLESEGYIIKKQGKGSFVSSPILVQNVNNIYVFGESLSKVGKDISTEVTQFEISKTSDDHIIKQLQIDPSDELYVFERLRSIENQPYLYEITYIPYNRVGLLTKGMLVNNSLYRILIEKYDVSITKADEEFRAVNSFKKIEKYLKIDENSAVLEITRTAYSKSLPVEYTVSYARGD